MKQERGMMDCTVGVLTVLIYAAAFFLVAALFAIIYFGSMVIFG